MWPAFSSTKMVPGCICSGIHSLRISSSATIFTLLGANLLLRTQSGFASCTNDATDVFLGDAPWPLTAADDRFYLANRIAQTYGKHRLAGIFQDVHNLLWRSFEVQAAAVGQQVITG